MRIQTKTSRTMFIMAAVFAALALASCGGGDTILGTSSEVQSPSTNVVDSQAATNDGQTADGDVEIDQPETAEAETTPDDQINPGESGVGESGTTEAGDDEAAENDDITETAAPQKIEVGDATGPELIAAFGQAVYSDSPTNAVFPGSAADTYLNYLLAITPLQNDPSDQGPLEVEDTGFSYYYLGSAGQEDTLLDYTEFVVGPGGVSDFVVNDRVMSTQIATVNEPVETADGLRVDQGTSYLTADKKSRIVVIQVENVGQASFEPELRSSRFIDTSDSKLRKQTVDITVPDVIAPGDTATIVFWAKRGDESPEGVLNFQLSDQSNGDDIEIDVPFGAAESAFFNFDEEGDVVGTLSADIAFETGSAELSAEAIEILKGVAEEAIQIGSDQPLCVAGHADSVGDEASNLSLSQDRAAAVAAELVSNSVSNAVDSVGFGEQQAPGDEQEDQASRRVDITFGACDS